jgi:hypothetical protein
MLRLILHLSFLALLFSCSSPQADLEEADRLIETGEYDKALVLLQKELMKEYGDTTQYARVRHRIFLVHKGQFFTDLERYRRQEAWKKAEAELVRLDSILQHIPGDSSRLFRFDYYIYRSEVDSMLGNMEAWSKNLHKATQFPLGSEEAVRNIFGRLAFYHAGREDMQKALEMMDSMLRTIQVRSLEPSLKSAFYLYMEGAFEDALGALKDLPASKKDRHWGRLEQFLSQYHNQLKQANRFKLW